MYKLNKVGAKTYYVNAPVNIGIFIIDNNDICLIDSGNNKDAGVRLQRIIEDEGWSLKMIFNTHSHADHIGGNRLLQQRLGAKVYSCKVECAFINNSILEPTYLFAGFPPKELQNKFLMAEESVAEEIDNVILPAGLETIDLSGHAMDMIGFRTSDDIYFLADSLTSEDIVNKYHIQFLYDVERYLQTLDKVEKLEGSLFIPSHSEPTEDIRPLVKINRDKVYEILEHIANICGEPISFESILKALFDKYNLTLNMMQYVLAGSTVRSYLSYLLSKGELGVLYKDNVMYWHSV